MSNAIRTNEDLGKFIIRFSIGFLMLFHGWHKVVNGIDYMGGMLEGIGLPAFISYGVYVGEIIAPLMLILGFRVRIAALLIIITMLFAIVLTDGDNIFSLSKYGAWAIELKMHYIFGSLAIFFLGDGKYSIDKK